MPKTISNGFGNRKENGSKKKDIFSDVIKAEFRVYRVREWMHSYEREAVSVDALLWSLVMNSNADKGYGSHPVELNYYTGPSIKYGISPWET